MTNHVEEILSSLICIRLLSNPHPLNLFHQEGNVAAQIRAATRLSSMTYDLLIYRLFPIQSGYLYFTPSIPTET